MGRYRGALYLGGPPETCLVTASKLHAYNYQSRDFKVMDFFLITPSFVLCFFFILIHFVLGISLLGNQLLQIF